MSSMFPGFFGNRSAVETLAQMARQNRIQQTILLAGPEGVGKATLARRFAAELIGDVDNIERDDLSLTVNANYIADREKWPADKRVDDPLLFASHPDFVTFPPDGPLRQISIQQMRLLKERAQFKPNHGKYRIFLIDQLDRANEQAANSLLKTLEEPPEHLILISTAENAYDLLPTIRSRAIILQLVPLTSSEMAAFAESRGMTNAERRIALAGGSPGLSLSVNLETYDKRRTAMLALLQVAAGKEPFVKWAKYSESLGASKSEKLEYHLKVLYSLLEDLLLLQHGAAIRNTDIRADLKIIADHVSFEWIRRAVARIDELMELLRRNIQKSIALDALVMELRGA